MYNEHWNGMMGISMFFWIILLLLIGFGLIKVLSKRKGTDLSAKQLLKRRYARGEINKDEYERMLKDLKLE